MQNELLFALAAGVGVEFLGVFGSAKGGQDQRLGLAPAEQGRAVRAGENADLAVQRANIFKTAAVHPFPAVQNQTAHGLLLEVIKDILEHELGDLFRAEFFDEFGAQFVRDRLDRGLARQFGRGQQRGHHAVARQGLGLVEDIIRHHVGHDGAFGFACAPSEFFLGRDDRLAGGVAKLQRGVKVRLRDFLGRPLEHDEFFFVSDINQVEVALGHLGVGGVGEELAIDAANAHGAQRSGPGNIADYQRRGGTDDAEDVRIIFSVGAQQDALHLHFVVPTLGKQRPDRPVNHAAGKDFLFRRAPFALEIAARESAGGGGFLAVVHRERKEILAGLGAGGGDCGDDHDCFSQLNCDGAVGLFGDFAGLEVNLLGPQLDRYFF